MKPLVVAVTVVASAASAQSLQDFVAGADRNNVDTRITIEQRNRAVADARQAWTFLLPSLSASASWTHNQYEAVANFPNPATGEVTKLVIIPGDQLDAALRFDLPLINTQFWFRSAAAASLEEATSLRATLTRDLVRKQVVASYFNYVATLAVLESAQKSVGVAQAQQKLMQVRRETGTNTDLDLLRANAEVARTQQVVADTLNLVATSRRALNSLSGVQVPEQIAQPEPDMSAAGELDEFQNRVDQTPAVQAADKDAEAAGRSATGARLAIVPQVGAQFTQRFTNATGFQNQFAVWNAGVNLSWRLDVPTFIGMQSQSASEATALINAEKARLNQRDTIHSDWQRLRAALSKVTAAQTQVEAARRATELAKIRYEAGAATQLEVIQAERDVFNAEVGHIQARTELAIARRSLKISAALPLE